MSDPPGLTPFENARPAFCWKAAACSGTLPPLKAIAWLGECHVSVGFALVGCGVHLLAIYTLELGAAGPAIASEWADLEISEAACFQKGEAAITRLGFGELERTRYSRYGQKGDYTVAVRCIVERKLVPFLAAGPTAKDTQNYQIELFKKFLEP